MTAQRSLGTRVPPSPEDRVYQEHWGLTVAEFEIVVAVLAYERTHAGAPVRRLDLIDFLEREFDSDRLVRTRFLARTDTVPSLLGTTVKARRVLGVKP